MADEGIRRVGDCRLLDIVGEGGFSIVYRAIDNIGRTVAVKMLRGEKDADLLERFRREAQSLAGLPHRNIVNFFYSGEHNGTPYMVMEYLEGQSMKQLIDSGRPVDLVEKLDLLIQVCDGLAHAHKKKVVHRDIKPANILILPDKTAKIVDFGIARITGGDDRTRKADLTRVGQKIGSDYYMSPEQTRGDPIDSRSDIFSAGVTLYHLLTYARPFEGPNYESVWAKIRNESHPPLSKYLPDYPCQLDEILNRALAKKPDDRYSTAEEFAFELQTVKRGMVDQSLAKAKAEVDHENWQSAQKILMDICEHADAPKEAKDLLKVVRKRIQTLRRSVQLAELRVQIEDLIVDRNFEAALSIIDQVLSQDPQESSFITLKETAQLGRDQAKRFRDLLRRVEESFSAGDLDTAGLDVDAAVQISPTDPAALAWRRTIDNEISERALRSQVKDLVDRARHAMVEGDFKSATEILTRATNLHPTDSNIRDLRERALKGLEDQKNRERIKEIADSVNNALGSGDYESACALIDQGLKSFPADLTLLRLKGLSEAKRRTAEQRNNVDAVLQETGRLMVRGNIAEAAAFLKTALSKYPDNIDLQTRLFIVEDELRCKNLATEQRQAVQHEPRLETLSRQADEAVLRALFSVRQAVSTGEPITVIEVLCAHLESEAQQLDASSQIRVLCETALRDVQNRKKLINHNQQELHELSGSIKLCASQAEMLHVVRKAEFIANQYPREPGLQEALVELRRCADEHKHQRDSAMDDINRLLDVVRTTFDSNLLRKHGETARLLAKAWPKEILLQGLFEQVSSIVSEKLGQRQQILAEIGYLIEKLDSPTSLGHLSRTCEELRRIEKEWAKDPEVESASAAALHTAVQKQRELEEDIERLKNLFSLTEGAGTIEQAEVNFARAKEIAANRLQVDFVQVHLVQLSARIESLRKKFEDVSRRLEDLLESVIKVTSLSELDGFSKDADRLLREFPDEPTLQTLHQALGLGIGRRRTQLSQQIYPSPEPLLLKDPAQDDGSGRKYRVWIQWSSGGLAFALIAFCMGIYISRHHPGTEKTVDRSSTSFQQSSLSSEKVPPSNQTQVTGHQKSGSTEIPKTNPKPPLTEPHQAPPPHVPTLEQHKKNPILGNEANSSLAQQGVELPTTPSTASANPTVAPTADQSNVPPSPPDASAPSPVTPTPDTPVRPSSEAPKTSLPTEDKNQIQEVLNRYAEAYHKHDTKGVQRIWPEVPQIRLDHIKQFTADHKKINATLVFLSAQHIETGWLVVCNQTLSYDQDGTMINQPSQLKLVMTKEPEGWRIKYAEN